MHLRCLNVRHIPYNDFICGKTTLCRFVLLFLLLQFNVIIKLNVDLRAKANTALKAATLHRSFKNGLKLAT